MVFMAWKETKASKTIFLESVSREEGRLSKGPHAFLKVLADYFVLRTLQTACKQYNIQ